MLSVRLMLKNYQWERMELRLAGKSSDPLASLNMKFEALSARYLSQLEQCVHPFFPMVQTWREGSALCCDGR
jgi:hypothetical protein